MGQDSRTFCYRCGNSLRAHSDRAWFCETCDYVQYDNPRPCVEVALFDNENRLLVSKRAFEPGKGLYDLPGGFVEMDETLEDALFRELSEETSLKQDEIIQVTYFKSFYVPYLWPPETYHNVVALFIAVINTNRSVVPSDDSEELLWVTREEVEGLSWALPQLMKNAQEVFQHRVG